MSVQRSTFKKGFIAGVVTLLLSSLFFALAAWGGVWDTGTLSSSGFVVDAEWGLRNFKACFGGSCETHSMDADEIQDSSAWTDARDAGIAVSAFVAMTLIFNGLTLILLILILPCKVLQRYRHGWIICAFAFFAELFAVLAPIVWAKSAHDNLHDSHVSVNSVTFKIDSSLGWCFKLACAAVVLQTLSFFFVIFVYINRDAAKHQAEYTQAHDEYVAPPVV